MTLALVVPLLLSPQAAGGAGVGRVDEPAIHVWLSQDGSYRHNDRAQVFVRMAEDGYLVVLRNDPDGHVQVLFPVNPGDDTFLRGGQTLEIRGAGDRDAFSIDQMSGTGVVLAARSQAPFRFDDFTQGNGWDVSAFDTLTPRSDKEAVLLAVVQQMSADGRFDYDDVSYSVEGQTASSYYGWSPQFVVPIFFGSGFGFRRHGCLGALFDPFFCDPFLRGPFARPPFPFGFKPRLPMGIGLAARPRLPPQSSAPIDRAPTKTTATGGPQLVQVIQLGRIQPTVPVAVSTHVPVRASERVRWPVRVPWPIRLDDREPTAGSGAGRGRESTPGRGVSLPVRECVNCAIPNVRVLEPSEVAQRGLTPPSTHEGGRGLPGARTAASPRGVTGPGWGGRRP